MFEDLAVVIPWRDIGDYWRNTSRKFVQQVYFDIGFEHVFFGDAGGDEFSRSASRNHIVEEVIKRGYKHLLIADADTIPFAAPLVKALNMVEHGAPWVIPYGNAGYFNVNKRSTEIILMGSADRVWTPNDITWDHQLESWAGQLVIPTKNYRKINGYDERFVGWGYEDNAFRVALDTICGPYERVEDGYTMALWHPAPNETTWQQPNIENNRRRYELYLACEGDIDSMKELVEGNRSVHI